MKTLCARCKTTYDVGFYAQHRVTGPHTNFVKPKQARYGGTTNRCLQCGEIVKPGEYKNHRLQKEHLESVNYGRRYLMREVAINLLKNRDDYIVTRLGDGASYATIGKELRLSRQRIHQIAKRMGMHSLSVPGVTITRSCFYDGDLYVDWVKHEPSMKHRLALQEFTDKVMIWRRSPGGE